MAEASTSARRIESALRQSKALQMRLAGMTFDAIRRAPRDAANGDMRPMYASRQRAHDAVKRALAEISEEIAADAAQIRQIELARLEAMHRAVWASATRPSKSVMCECGCGHVMWRDVDKEAIDRVLKLQERRAKYLPLEVKGDEVDHSKAASMIGAIMDALDVATGDQDFVVSPAVLNVDGELPDAGPDD